MRATGDKIEINNERIEITEISPTPRLRLDMKRFARGQAPPYKGENNEICFLKKKVIWIVLYRHTRATIIEAHALGA